ncbi:MAG: DNA primase [Alphaproteobacteria bacterium]|nr:DNA primase [Alphaproteobacteria bacterium]
MSITPRFLDELRMRLQLSDIVGKRVRLQRAGRELKGRCPFHNEKTPSFYVNDDKQFYHCFGCGAHGDVIGFVMQHDNLSFIDAVEMLAALAGMQVPRATPEERARADKEKSLYTLMEDAAKYMEAQLRNPVNRDALDYLRGRGIGEAALSAFRVGYAPDDGQAIAGHLRGLGYSDEQMIEADILRSSSRGGAPYAFFRDRVMFPVPDRRGRIVAFGGRILPEHLRPARTGDFKPPKYMNSSDTPLFHKGRMLYGEPHARQAAADGLPLIVVEGYLDVISCFEAGFRGALAPLGTALTEEQIQVIWKLIPDGERAPILCFDGDEAGRRAARRAADRILPFLKPDHTARFAFLPEGEDPDSLIRGRGRRAFQSVLDAAMPLSGFLWTIHAAGRAFDTPESQAGLAETLDQEALKIPDRQLQSYYRESFRQKMREFVWQQNRRRAPAGAGRRPLPSSGVSIVRPARQAKDGLRQQILVSALVNHPAIFESVEDDLMALALPEARLGALRDALLVFLQENEEPSAVAVRDHLIALGHEEMLDKLLSDSIYIHAGFARPEAEIGKVLEGWRHTFRLIGDETVAQEQRSLGKVFGAETTDEMFERICALHELNKPSDG